MKVAPKNATLTRLEPFVVATPENLVFLDRSPLGLPIADDACFDPLRMSSEPFLTLLSRLDALSFGPEGMPMPRWLFFDGAEMPGAIVGLARRGAAISEAARRLFELDDGYEGLVPYAMYIAIPTVEEGTWFGHNLASIGPQLPEEGLRGLGSLTKALALAALRCQQQVGATQWDSHALHVHIRLGPLALLTAWTPAHSEPWSLTYRASVTEPALLHLARDPRGKVTLPAPDRWVAAGDHDAMQTLQAEIEAGARYVVCGAPRTARDGVEVPIARTS